MQNTNFFDIAIAVLQGGTLALYMFIICRNYVDRSNKIKWLHTKKKMF